MSPRAATLSEEQLDRAFGALADPTRRAILARLTAGDAGVLEVASPFPMSQPAVTKHLRVLEEAGLISRHRVARQRLCRLEPRRLEQLSDWVGSYREYWEQSFERLDELLEEMQAPAAPAPAAPAPASAERKANTTKKTNTTKKRGEGT
jgi:DNA-binding transcriptional ArsR family regulator